MIDRKSLVPPEGVDGGVRAGWDSAWERDIAELLEALSATQQELLEVLAWKRRVLLGSDWTALADVQARETQLADRLEACRLERARLLEQAGAAGLACDSLQALSTHFAETAREEMRPRFSQVSTQARLLQHQGLANWVVVQRTLLHLSHLLEIIATGGRAQPTYGKEPGSGASGALVDQAA